MPADLLQLLSTGGGMVVLAFIAIAFLKGWIVSSAQYREMTQDRDDWKEIALGATSGAREVIALTRRRRADGGRGHGRDSG